MIGVLADPSKQEVVREFFELFKTPWEFYQHNRVYEVVLCVGDQPYPKNTSLVLVYSGTRLSFDDRQDLRTSPLNLQLPLEYRDHQIPLYGPSVAFLAEKGFLTAQRLGHSVCVFLRDQDTFVARIGYDLFHEVQALLTEGQPPAHAASPTLELHIALLRDLITSSGLQLLEIPPVPDGYSFIVCLTHDVDHPAITFHQWDHTIAGFIYRAVVGSLVDFVRSRTTLRAALSNWIAVFKLPFIYFGIANDFWRDFAKRYQAAEQGLNSTFFLIPFRNTPGKTVNGFAPKFRAARYGAADLSTTIDELTQAGCEVALHGIDAWIDSSRGQVELEEIRRLTKARDVGVRMHWLYYESFSPAALDAAGASYDSTIGYNSTVGYRAGTLQAYKPFGATRLLELPLHGMDTALFYPGYLALSSHEALARLQVLVRDAMHFGGCLTLNWHDRSLAPERMWDVCYRELVNELRDKNAWFATSGQAAAWFRKRRSVVFGKDSKNRDIVVEASHAETYSSQLPGLRLRIHHPQPRSKTSTAAYADLPCLATVGTETLPDKTSANGISTAIAP